MSLSMFIVKVTCTCSVNYTQVYPFISDHKISSVLLVHSLHMWLSYYILYCIQYDTRCICKSSNVRRYCIQIYYYY